MTKYCHLTCQWADSCAISGLTRKLNSFNYRCRSNSLLERGSLVFLIVSAISVSMRSKKTHIPRNGFLGLSLCCLVLSSVGCSTFNALEKHEIIYDSPVTQVQPVQIQRGRPRPIIDAAGKFFGLPNRIAIGKSGIDSHSVSHATEMKITNYLEQNNLNSVLIRSNQYAPLDEFKRTLANDRIRPIWKSTFGTYNLLKYTLLPGRIVGGDWYNPYSNSLHVYSCLLYTSPSPRDS